MTNAPTKIAFGELRASGVRDVLIYCRDHRCSHHVEVSTDQWPDNIRLSDAEPDFVCTTCGRCGIRRPAWVPGDTDTKPRLN